MRRGATRAGNFFGLPPTGRKVNVYVIAMLRIVGGHMVEVGRDRYLNTCCIYRMRSARSRASGMPA